MLNRDSGYGSLFGEKTSERIMIEQLLALWFFVGPILGIPLLVIGVILRLREGSCGKGGRGSIWYLIAGVVLSLPSAVYFACGLLM